MMPASDDFKPRRSHRKSRNGCRECKRRHVKCDETRPRCVNCVTAERECSFLEARPALPTPPLGAAALPAVLPASRPHGAVTSTQDSRTLTPQPISPSIPPSTVAAAILSPASHHEAGSLPLRTDVYIFTLDHLALLHHASTSAVPPAVTAETIHPLMHQSIQSALTVPYLMDALLGLSALHLSHRQSERRDFYRHQATELQTRALSVFNTAKPAFSTMDATCVSNFIFSSVLGVHVLSETLSRYRDDFDCFLGKFADYVQVHRGVRAVVADDAWGIIRQAELLSELIDATQEIDIENPIGRESEPLLQMLDAAGGTMVPEAVAACKESVKVLQWTFDLYNHMETPCDRYVHVPMAWPVILPVDYIEVLRNCCPEAVVILAHWAVLLHRGRSFWVFGNAGRWLFEMIESRLGSYWEVWLAWPRKEIIGDG